MVIVATTYNVTDFSFEDMKRSITKSGGLFYQYRPCRRDISTVYDIENIRHGEVYAQTPLNMNDPFDSMVGYSADNIFDEIVTMILDALGLENDFKAVAKAFIMSRQLDKLAYLLENIRVLRNYIIKKQKDSHQTAITLQQFVNSSAKNLYNKAPKELKNEFSYNLFLAFAAIVGKLGDIEITEQSVLDCLGLNDSIAELYNLIEDIPQKTFFPKMKEVISTLTASCFSTSGWDNQLMWSHYANSYKGICVEYDFNEMNDFIGFVYPITYSLNRPVVSLSDFGIEGIDIKSNEMIYGDTNMSKIMEFFCTKNKCWEYEKEWRILNIGEANSPRFIKTPFIKSVTFGLDVDPLCKRLLIDVCKDKGIDCYDLQLDCKDFALRRKQIDVNALTYGISEDANYIILLYQHLGSIYSQVTSNCNYLNAKMAAGEFDDNAVIELLKQQEEVISDMCFLKSAFNMMCKNISEEMKAEDVPKEISNSIVSINNSIPAVKDFLKAIQVPVVVNMFKGQLAPYRYKEIQNLHNRINNAISKYEELGEWNPLLLGRNENA